ncbi:hypothetical protein [Geobacillus stearothermophilus]
MTRKARRRLHPIAIMAGLGKEVNYPPPTLRLELGASSDLCVFAER